MLGFQLQVMHNGQIYHYLSFLSWYNDTVLHSFSLSLLAPDSIWHALNMMLFSSPPPQSLCSGLR